MAKLSKSRLEQRGQLEEFREELKRKKWHADGVAKNIADLLAPMDIAGDYTLAVNVERMKAHATDLGRIQKQMLKLQEEIVRLEAELGAEEGE